MDFIVDATVDALKSLYGADISPADVVLQQTRKEFEGQVTLVTFSFTKLSRKSPEVTGKEIGEFITSHAAAVTGFNVIKGFLNLSIDDSYWIKQLYQVIGKPDFGTFPAKGQKVMVEYSSPNTNKPLHLGHVRNNLLGYSVAEILKANGYEVIKANLVNDRGIHICKSMLAWQKFGGGETPKSSGLKGDHLVGKYYVAFDKEYKKQINNLTDAGQNEEDAKKNAPIIIEAQQMLEKWEAGDPEVIDLWKTMNSWVYAGFKETYEKLGVDFDRYYYESDTYLLGKDIVEEGLQKGVFFKKEDGSVWIDLTADGLDEKLVLRSNGTSVYITQDLGTAQLKYDDYGMDRSVYVVGNEQDYHFKVLFLILQKLGKTWAKGLFHLSYGMVDLPSGKMKSREGTVVDADDLMAEMSFTAKEYTEAQGKINDFGDVEKQSLYQTIGMGALKYYLLKVEPKKRLLFDPNESVDLHGHTGPFIQYAHARIKSVLSKGNYQPHIETIVTELPQVERDLIMSLNQFPDAIALAADTYNPAVIANHVYEVAKIYNRFYQESPIMKAESEEIKNFRLSISAATANVIAKAMALLGIHVPERM